MAHKQLVIVLFDYFSLIDAVTETFINKQGGCWRRVQKQMIGVEGGLSWTRRAGRCVQKKYFPSI